MHNFGHKFKTVSLKTVFLIVLSSKNLKWEPYASGRNRVEGNTDCGESVI